MQDQLWNAGPVKIIRGSWGDKARDARKTADGRNKQRKLRERAAKHGMSVADYLRHREERKAAARPAYIPKEPVTKTCVECGTCFTTTRPNQLRCSDPNCRRKAKNRSTSASIMRRYYTDPGFRDDVIASSHVRRAEKLGLGGRKITIGYLLERDGWRCGICHTRIRKRDDASIDHIVPLSTGGEHTLENVHAAHLRCNYSKNARGGGEQLLLIG